MNTTANFQVFPTPLAFKGKRQKSKAFMSQNLDNILQCDMIMPKHKLLLDQIKKSLIQNTLNVKIEGNISLGDFNVKDFFKYVSANMNDGKIKLSLVRQYLNDNCPGEN